MSNLKKSHQKVIRYISTTFQKFLNYNSINNFERFWNIDYFETIGTVSKIKRIKKKKSSKRNCIKSWLVCSISYLYIE